MKKTTSFLLFLALLFVSNNQLFAQYDDEKIDSNRVEIDQQPGKERKPFTPKGLFVGSILNVAFFNGLFAEISPYVGYRVFDLLAVGVGTGYSVNISIQNQYNYQGYNLRAFAKLRPIKEGGFSQLYFYGEYAQLVGFFNNAAYNPASPTAARYVRRSGIATNVGFGYTNNFAEGFGITTEFLYDISFDRTVSIQNSPFSMRFGVYYGF